MLQNIITLQSVYYSLDICSYIFLADDAQNLQNCISKEKQCKKTKIIIIISLDYNKIIYETYVLPLNVFCMCLITNICHSRSDIKGKEWSKNGLMLLHC